MVEEKRKIGFTLIELLVVIAITALMLAFVLPTLNTGHPHSPKRLCRINSRQLVIAFLLYHQENESLINKNNWSDSLQQYFIDDNEVLYKKIYLCPTDKTGPCSYAMNENIPADANELPEDLVLLFESNPGWNQIGGPDDVVTDRHGKNNPGANIAFADGHIKFVNAEDIPHLRWTVD